jgi:hypothetical protein
LREEEVDIIYQEKKEKIEEDYIRLMENIKQRKDRKHTEEEYKQIPIGIIQDPVDGLWMGDLLPGIHVILGVFHPELSVESGDHGI